MKTKMKILIAYDGLSSFARILNDLRRAGLPKNVEATVVTVVDAFVIPDAGYAEIPLPSSTLIYVEAARKTALKTIKAQVRIAHTTASQAAARIRGAFPSWTVRAEAFADSPAWGIVKKAIECSADLVVVGSHNQPPLTRFFLGSVAQKVVAEAPCSVRIVHGDPQEVSSPARLVIGVDGSVDSELAVNEVAARSWKKGCAAHVITGVDMRMSTTAAAPGFGTEKWIKKQDRKEKEWVRRMVRDFEGKLKKTGLAVSSLIREGDPKKLVLQEAARWGADCIFVGARGLNMIERFFMGSVSSAVAARAHCTVEVVRPKQAAGQMHCRLGERTRTCF